jgi:hypothetical protein
LNSGYFHQETSNEEENNEDSEGNEDQEAEAENSTLSTLSGVTASYGAETTPQAQTFELAALQLPKKVMSPKHGFRFHLSADVHIAPTLST